MKNPLLQFRAATGRHPRRSATLGVLLLAAGSALITWHMSETTPDPATVSLEDAAGFIRGDAFANLSSQARDEYLKQLAARYFRESAANRALLDKAFADAGVDRPLKRQIALGMVRSLLGDYDQLDPAVRKSRAAALRAFAGAMGFTQGTAEALDPSKNPVASALKSSQSFDTWMGRFERDLLVGLSAEERSKLRDLAHDVRGPQATAR